MIRPHPIERAQLAAVFGLFGAVLGMLIVAVGLLALPAPRPDPGTNRITRGLVPPGRTIGRQPALGGRHLLEKVAGEKPVGFDALYDKAIKAREDAEHQLGIQRTINETLAERTKELETCAAKLTADLETAKKDLDRAEKDAKDAPKLREQNRQARGIQPAAKGKAR